MFTLIERVAASVPTPPAGKVSVFVDIADGILKYRDDTGALNSFVGASGTPLQRLYDDAGGYKYAGIAPTGDLTSASTWTIRRMTYVAGVLTATEEATAVDWDNRVTHTYA